MKKQLATLFAPFLCGIVTLLSTGCNSTLSPWSDLDEKAARVPHVALAPIKVSCKNPTPWDLSQEMNFFFEKQLMESGELKISSSTFLRAHQRVPPSSLWRSADLGPARLLLPHDFVVLSQVTKYQLVKEQNQEGLGKIVQGAKHTKPYFYQVEAFVRVIDLTGSAPRLAMQQNFRLQIPISNAQLQTDQTLNSWTSGQYFGGGHATVCAKLTSAMAKAVSERILQAWSRRLPLSRYPSQVHSKL